MAELVPVPFADLVNRLYQEAQTNDAVFGLPRKKWYVSAPSDLDLSVRFHDQLAGNPSGPAAGPQTQMAQNLLLSYVAGGRILELKTVQVNDELKIPRPCIDMTNVGYNVEWSQELRVEQSLREYVAGMMLIEMFRRDPVFAGKSLIGAAGEVIYDMSIGYDLAGIRSEKVQRFLDGMRDAGALIDELRAEIPSKYARARELEYATHLSGTLTLSTFHGCPANEIERICEHLIADRGLDVIVKMNPPMLGRERLEHLLYDVLGYTDLKVNPTAYTSGLQFDEGVALVGRLMSFAQQRGRRFGCKFSNTLEVLNHRQFFTSDNQVQYLSGQPLYVVTMTLTDVFRQAVGAHVPISFSAGIDSKNFPLAVACGFVPVTTCSDLLRPGGYGRLPAYLKALSDAMRAVGALDIGDFVASAFGSANPQAVQLHNTSVVAEKARLDPRYRAPQNRAVPKRIDSHLVTFDCITCDKCIPVCPNAANFTYPTPQVEFEFHDLILEPSGELRENQTARQFKIDRGMQIANFADFCNECGNCDTFCPEYGGPYIKKPSVYSTIESWRRAAPRDGFVIDASVPSARARIHSHEYHLAHHPADRRYTFSDGVASLELSDETHDVVSCGWLVSPPATLHRVDLGVYHTMRHLLAGLIDRRFVNSVNAR